MVVTTLYTDGLLRPVPDLTADEKSTVDAMNDEFVTELSEPLSRILARNPLNKKYGRGVVDSYDWLAIVIAAWGYHRDLGEVRARRRAAVELKKQQSQLTQPPPGANPHVQFDPTATASGTDEPAIPSGFAGIAIPPGAADLT